MPQDIKPGQKCKRKLISVYKALWSFGQLQYITRLIIYQQIYAQLSEKYAQLPEKYAGET